MTRTPLRQLVLGAAFAALLSACAASAQPEGDVRPSPTVRGQAIAEANCAVCHAIGAEGASPHVDAPPFRSLSQNYPVGALAEAFAEGILVGHSDMPEFRLEPDQIEAMIAYLESVQSQ
jgi:Cytochrome c, mono- and diheme variants